MSTTTPNIAAFYDPATGVFVLSGLPQVQVQVQSVAANRGQKQCRRGGGGGGGGGGRGACGDDDFRGEDGTGEEADEAQGQHQAPGSITISAAAVVTHANYLAGTLPPHQRPEKWVSSSPNSNSINPLTGDGEVVWWYCHAEITYPAPSSAPSTKTRPRKNTTSRNLNPNALDAVGARIRAGKAVVVFPGPRGALRRVGEGGRGAVIAGARSTSRSEAKPLVLHLPVFIAGERKRERETKGSVPRTPIPTPRTRPRLPVTLTQLKRVLAVIATPTACAGGAGVDRGIDRGVDTQKITRFVSLPARITVRVARVRSSSDGDDEYPGNEEPLERLRGYNSYEIPIGVDGAVSGLCGGHRRDVVLGIYSSSSPSWSFPPSPVSFSDLREPVSPAGLCLPGEISLCWVLMVARDIAVAEALGGGSGVDPRGVPLPPGRTQHTQHPGKWEWAPGGVWCAEPDGGDNGGGRRGRGRGRVTDMEREGWEGWERDEGGDAGDAGKRQGKRQGQGEPLGIWDVVWRRALGGLGGGVADRERRMKREEAGTGMGIGEGEGDFCGDGGDGGDGADGGCGESSSCSPAAAALLPWLVGEVWVF